MPGKPGEREVADRLLGAWQGRAAGCLLGKPVEGWAAPKIRAQLAKAGAWPLADYFPAKHWEPLLKGRPDLVRCLKGRINCSARDDDMDYPILNLLVLEKYGSRFTAADVGKIWLERMPIWQVFTAERAAYGALIRDVWPPRTAVFLNPYREWIGAQIRADLWGWVNPGDPARAAEFAMRDASLSHVKNGVYGEMWVAAALAAVLGGAEIRGALKAGLAVIPEKSRLAEAIRNTAWWCQTSRNWEEVLANIRHTYGRYSWVHTINNACLVVMALLCGEGDFGRTISIAVMGGWDTDCNGATAGSITGAMLGAKGLPAKWIAPMNDRLECGLALEGAMTISSLARRTLNLAMSRAA
jgi:ADP-ribosylglycohydrolase